MKYLAILLGVILPMSIANASEFKVAQKWIYKTRNIESGSILTIVKIDEIEGSKIIHISIEGLKIKSPQTPDGFVDELSHLPISEVALKSSVTKMLGTATALPDFKEGYQIWKEAFDKGEGGVFPIPVSECVEYMEKTINQ